MVSNGETGIFAGIAVEAVPAYDLTPGAPLHPKGEANGYVITLGGRRIFERPLVSTLSPAVNPDAVWRG